MGSRNRIQSTSGWGFFPEPFPVSAKRKRVSGTSFVPNVARDDTIAVVHPTYWRHIMRLSILALPVILAIGHAALAQDNPYGPIKDVKLAKPEDGKDQP